MVYYTYAHTVEADVPAEAVWDLYRDVSTWPAWDPGTELVTLDGPFETGTPGSMKLVGQDAMTFVLARVEPLREFVDETTAGDMLVRVSHLLEPLGDGRLRITYALEIEGPAEQAQQAGPMITADFPDVMASLVAMAQSRRPVR